MRRAGEFDVAFRTNRDGLRDDEIAPRSGARVLLLGDSFASGYGVERGELFADLLEQSLDVDVVNAAVGGFEIVHQVHYYAARGRKLQPDLVLYALYLGNDLSRNREWKEGPRGDGLVALRREFPLRTTGELKLVALLKQLRYQKLLDAESERGEWEPFPDYVQMCERVPSSETAEQWAEVEDLLERLRDRVHESGAKLLVATFSYSTALDPEARARYLARHPEFGETRDFSVPRVRTAEILARLGIDLVELDPVIERHYREGGSSLYFSRDGHWNAAGHREVAAALEVPLRLRLAP